MNSTSFYLRTVLPSLLLALSEFTFSSFSPQTHYFLMYIYLREEDSETFVFPNDVLRASILGSHTGNRTPNRTVYVSLTLQLRYLKRRLSLCDYHSWYKSPNLVTKRTMVPSLENNTKIHTVSAVYFFIIIIFIIQKIWREAEEARRRLVSTV